MKRRTSISALLATGLLALTAGATMAHGLSVTPPGQDDPVVSGPVSRGWALAHCRAAAPEKATAASPVVAFNPPSQLGCPTSANPGGQVAGP